MSTAIDTQTGILPEMVGWDRETIARVGWACIARPGDPGVGQLIAAHGAAAALEMVAGTREVEWDGIRLRPIRVGLAQQYSTTAVRRALDATVRNELAVVTPGQPGWPPQLTDLGAGAPFALWVRGDARVLGRPSIAVTGTRRPSPMAVHTVLDIASALASRGYVIASTAIAGVDAVAVRAALVIDETALVALPSGIARAESSDAAPLLDEVAVRGAVVSELPPDIPEDRVSREAQCRLVAGLATTVVAVDTGAPVVELPVVQHGLAVGRPVGVIAATSHPSDDGGIVGVTRVRSVEEVAWL
jgi:DNA processing protein